MSRSAHAGDVLCVCVCALVCLVWLFGWLVLRFFHVVRIHGLDKCFPDMRARHASVALWVRRCKGWVFKFESLFWACFDAQVLVVFKSWHGMSVCHPSRQGDRQAARQSVGQSVSQSVGKQAAHGQVSSLWRAHVCPGGRHLQGGMMHSSGDTGGAHSDRLFFWEFSS